MLKSKKQFLLAGSLFMAGLGVSIAPTPENETLAGFKSAASVLLFSASGSRSAKAMGARGDDNVARDLDQMVKEIQEEKNSLKFG